MRFEADKIQEFLNDAIYCVFKHEKQLLEDECSERAITHWLANYFWCAVKKNDVDGQYKDYVVDIEYNRIGQGKNPKETFKCDGKNCQYRYKDKCIKRLLEEHETMSNEESNHNPQNQERKIMIDMIFHRRGRNDLESNVFCLELKTTSTSEDDYKTMCDKERIKTLVYNPDNKVRQQCGAAVHIYSVEEAKVEFFCSQNHNCEKYIYNSMGKKQPLKVDEQH